VPGGSTSLLARDLGGPMDPVPEELYEGPEDWVNLRKMAMAGGWGRRTQQARLAQYDSKIGWEDVSTYIQDAGTARFIRGGETGGR
jgi:hypothetical protein